MRYASLGLVIASLVASPAFGHGKPVHTQGQGQSQSQGQGQGQGQLQTNGNASTSLSTGSSTFKMVVPPNLSSLVGTPCMGSTTASAGAAGFGIGLGTSWNDPECQLRENIKIVAQFDPYLAQEMLKGLSGVKEAQERALMPPQTSSYEPPIPTNPFAKPYWCRTDMSGATEADKKACNFTG